MKILVLSDSHGCMDYMYCAVESEQPDQILHLGDHAQDARMLQAAFPQIPVLGVRGNCDWQDAETEIRVTVFGGIRIYMTHGHLFGVKQTPYRAILAAEEADAAVLLYGHTHQAACFCEGALTVLNPGSCMGTNPITYGVLTVEAGMVQGQIQRLEKL